MKLGSLTNICSIDKRIEESSIYIKWDDTPENEWLICIYLKDDSPTQGIVIEDKTDPRRKKFVKTYFTGSAEPSTKEEDAEMEAILNSPPFQEAFCNYLIHTSMELEEISIKMIFYCFKRLLNCTKRSSQILINHLMGRHVGLDLALLTLST